MLTVELLFLQSIDVLLVNCKQRRSAVSRKHPIVSKKAASFSIRMSSSPLKWLLLVVASVVKNPTMIRVTLLCGRALSGRALWRLLKCLGESATSAVGFWGKSSEKVFRTGSNLLSHWCDPISRQCNRLFWDSFPRSRNHFLHSLLISSLRTSTFGIT